jgi:hypothetical protein
MAPLILSLLQFPVSRKGGGGGEERRRRRIMQRKERA